MFRRTRRKFFPYFGPGAGGMRVAEFPVATENSVASDNATRRYLPCEETAVLNYRYKRKRNCTCNSCSRRLGAKKKLVMKEYETH